MWASSTDTAFDEGLLECALLFVGVLLTMLELPRGGHPVTFRRCLDS